MLDIGFSELAVVGVVALIVVGPKDLPKLFRTLGQVTGKAKGMAREFTRAMNDAADGSGFKDVSKMATDLRKMTNPTAMGLDGLSNSIGDLTDDTPKPKIDPNSATGKLSAERQAAKDKIHAAAVRTAEERKAKEEAAAAEEAAPKADPAPAKPAAKPKPAAKAKPAAKPKAAPKTAKPKAKTAAKPKAAAKTPAKPAAAKPAKPAKPADDA